MTWVPLLLADPSPCLRLLVLRDLLGRPENDPELIELAQLRKTDPLIANLTETQEPEGSWRTVDLLSHMGSLRATAQALARLGYLGFGPDHHAVAKGADYLFSLQREDGAWPIPTDRHAAPDAHLTEQYEGYSMMPLQTALPLMGLAACGYANDARAERAYDWLLAQRLPDGAWPTGIASGSYGYVAGYRRLAHSRWGCRSNTTGALSCLALHPTRRSEPEARRALDLLLGRETYEKHILGYEAARLIGAEPTRGFLTFYARVDAAHVLNLCWRVGATSDDARVANLVAFVGELQGPYGLWTYTPRPQASRWVTLDLLRSLARLERDDERKAEWVSLEPRTPFQAYTRAQKRY